MANGLSGITNANVRDSVSCLCITKILLANDAGSTADVEWTAAGVHSIDGVWQTDLATSTGLDISGLPALSRALNYKGDVIDAFAAIPARVAGDGSFGDAAHTLVYLLTCIGTTSYIIESMLSNASQEFNEEALMAPSGHCVVGAVKIVLATTADAFTFGTTALTGITGQTVTYHDLDGRAPSSKSSL